MKLYYHPLSSYSQKTFMASYERLRRRAGVVDLMEAFRK